MVSRAVTRWTTETVGLCAPQHTYLLLKSAQTSEGIDHGGRH